MKVYQVKLKNQEKPQKKRNFSDKSVITYQVDTIYDQLTSARGALAQVANVLIGLKRRHSRIKVTQTYAAKAAGYQSRTTGHKAMHQLASGPFMGMYRSRYLKGGVLWDEPCDVELSPILFTPYARKKLGALLPALHEFMCLSNLISHRISQQTCTLNKNGYTKVIMHPAQTLHLGVKLLLNYYLQQNEAPPLPGSGAYESSIVSNNFLKREDYEQFADSIGATTDAGTGGATSELPTEGH